MANWKVKFVISGDPESGSTQFISSESRSGAKVFLTDICRAVLPRGASIVFRSIEMVDPDDPEFAEFLRTGREPLIARFETTDQAWRRETREAAERREVKAQRAKEKKRLKNGAHPP